MLPQLFLYSLKRLINPVKFGLEALFIKLFQGIRNILPGERMSPCENCTENNRIAQPHSLPAPEPFEVFFEFVGYFCGLIHACQNHRGK